MRQAILAVSVFFLASFFVSPAQAQEPPPISAYGELPSVERAVMSPSGKRIAVVMTLNGQRMILAFEGKTIITRMSVPEIKIRGLEWVGEDRLMLIKSGTVDLPSNFTADKAEFFSATILPLADNQKPGIVFAKNPNMMDVIIGDFGVRKIDGRYYGFFGAIVLKSETAQGYKYDHGRRHLYRVDLQDLTTRRLAKAAPPGHSSDWLIAADGTIAATLEMNDDSGRWTLSGPDGKIASGKNPAGRTWLRGLGYNGQTAILGDNLNGTTNYMEYPLAGGEAKPFLPDADFDRLYFDRSTGHLMGYFEGGSKPRPVFADESHNKAVKQTFAAFKDYEVSMRGWTDDLSNVIVRISGNQESGSWFTVDINNQRANALAYERPEIEPQHVGPISTFQYEARDGLELDGILTLPPGKEPKNLPLVMMPHGGPHSYDSPAFDWWAQAFASRGYAVFQPNFRGSTHKSQAFRTAGYGEWGGKMQNDKTDGLLALAEKGIIDPKRACIVGASYGGYAALAGVTLEQDIYRCAVAVAPVSDINDMYQQDYRASAQDGTTKASLLQSLGPRNSWDAVSPLRKAENADAPVLLIHGKDDIVVPYSHSENMADKLKDHGKDYEMLTLEGEDHWLSLSDTRKKMLEASVAFVKKHNPAD